MRKILLSAALISTIFGVTRIFAEKPPEAQMVDAELTNTDGSKYIVKIKKVDMLELIEKADDVESIVRLTIRCLNCDETHTEL